MKDLLIFAAIVIFGLIPFGFGVLHVLYKKTIVFTAATTVFLASMFTGIVSFGVSEFGFNSLYWAIPLCLVFLVSMNAAFKSKIQKPLIRLNDSLALMSKGVLNIEIPKDILTKDSELGIVASSLNTTLKGLHNTSHFAKEIAKGNFDLEYNLLSDDDEIGLALIAMQKSLIESAKKEQKRQQEEKNNTYINTGLAKFGDILRLNNDDMSAMANNLLKELVDYIGAVQAGLFVLNEDDEIDIHYELAGAIAFDRKKRLEKKFRVGEGLVGRCVFERLPIIMTELPDDYINITSGLGEANPNCILLVPAKVEDKVYAVIEFASFSKFEPHIIKFIEKISENIASVIANVRNNEQTKRLLEESKTNNEEMAAQEEELRQNIEELHATQEEMKRKEEQLDELSKKLEEQEEILKQKLEELNLKEE